MFEYIEQNPEVFYTVVSLIFVYNIIIFVVGGKKAESIFSPLNSQSIKFREKGVSGYATTSLKTKMGGASRVLDIIVTDDELWVKGIFSMFSYIGSKHNLLHRIPLASIQSATQNGKHTHISFSTNSGETELVLQIKASRQFIKAIADKSACP